AILLPVQVVSQILGGLLLGWLAAQVLNLMLNASRWVQNVTQATLITACLALGLVVGAAQFPLFSGYLAVMMLGFSIAAQNPPEARRLRQGFSCLWAIAQIMLFVILGASIQLNILEQSLIPGAVLLAIGTLVGRGLGWYLSTLGSNWTRREKFYLLAGNSAKATVQAAIGAIPLAAGVPGGDIILALSALSILITAPLGAWAIPFFGRRMLSQDEVDPTKVVGDHRLHLGVVVDGSASDAAALDYVAHLARCGNATVTLLFQAQEVPEPIKRQAAQKLSDIPHAWRPGTKADPENLGQQTLALKVDQLVVGGLQDWRRSLLQQSPVPVLFVPQVYSEK
ncbi:MAG: cation:proton antiporter, partial [Cyanobacteria bacterium P01_F01_bin.42]